MNPLNHVAIIMDGNGRWGLQKKNNRNYGHKEGLKTVEKIISQTIKQKINYLTLYAFSTENWNRPQNEINYLFNLLEVFLKTKIRKFNENDIKLKIIGEKKFSNKLNKLLISSEKLTRKNHTLQVNLALNYGSKLEIIRAVNMLKKKDFPINEKKIVSKFFTSGIPDPEILIRTGNTKRLSNFLLWQLAYAEIFFVKKLWPDFQEADYIKIIKKFKKTKRNYGSI